MMQLAMEEPMQRGRVLVVDDDPDVVVYLASLLGDNGYDVTTAGNVRSALASIELSRPEVVLIDVLMPGMSGLNLLVELRTNARLCDIGVVIVTGSDQVVEDGCRSYLKAHGGVRGPEAILGKPVDIEQLLTALEKLVPS